MPYRFKKPYIALPKFARAHKKVEWRETQTEEQKKRQTGVDTETKHQWQLFWYLPLFSPFIQVRESRTKKFSLIKSMENHSGPGRNLGVVVKRYPSDSMYIVRKMMSLLASARFYCNCYLDHPMIKPKKGKNVYGGCFEFH